MNKEQLLKDNYAKADTTSCPDICKRFIDESFSKNLLFQITEGKRSHERQCRLLTQGRTPDDIRANKFYGGFKLSAAEMAHILSLYTSGQNLFGPIVTHTLRSEHILGNAIDLTPVGCSHSDIEMVAIRYNIVRPFLIDPPHYRLTNAMYPEPVMNLTPEAKIKSLERRIASETSPTLLQTLGAQLARLRKRLRVK